jgi:ribose/xylose/arabinose/galactoside ABC-type transport system permease subunit
MAAAARSLAGRRGAQGWADLLFVPVVTLALVVYFSSVNEFFLTELNITNILVQGSILAIVAFGVTFVILAGELDLSVGSGIALVSVISAFAIRDAGIPEGILVGLAVGIALGVVNGLVITQLEVPSFIATFGMLVIAHGIALALTDGGVVSGLPLSVGNLANEGILGVRWIIWLTIAVFLALYFVQTQTAFGVRVLAVGGNRQAAHLTGIKVDRIRFLVFVISGMTMGVAGLALTARLESGQPNAGALLELDAIAAIVIGGTSIFGGRGSVMRTLWGVLLISVLRNGLDVEGVGDDLKQIIIGVVLIAAASVDFVRRRFVRRRDRRSAVAGVDRRGAKAPAASS